MKGRKDYDCKKDCDEVQKLWCERRNHFRGKGPVWHKREKKKWYLEGEGRPRGPIYKPCAAGGEGPFAAEKCEGGEREKYRKAKFVDLFPEENRT